MLYFLRVSLLALLFSLFLATSYAQVGIGTNTPNPKAALELSDTARGFLPPRMTTAQRVAMALNATHEGMIVYDTQKDSLFLWRGLGWQVLGGGNGMAQSNSTEISFLAKRTSVINPVTGSPHKVTFNAIQYNTI